MQFEKFIPKMGKQSSTFTSTTSLAAPTTSSSSSNSDGDSRLMAPNHLATLEPIPLVQVCKAPAVSDEKHDLSCWWRRTRIHVALLGLAIAAVNCYAQVTFCIAIVEMVLPADYVANGLNDTLTPVVGVSFIGPTGGQSSPVNIDDLSCPIEIKYRDYYDSWRFPAAAANSSANNTSTSATNTNAIAIATNNGSESVARATADQVDLSNRFDWDASQQGLLLGAFAFGTAPLQIVGGRLAEIYGSKWVLLAGCIGTALTNLATPHIAHLSFVLLLANRILMGVTQAGMEAGLMCLMADWLTPQEAGFFISMSLFAICFGFFLGALFSSLILGLGYGWPLAYYVSGGLNLAVGLVWYFYADSWPHASRHISNQELAYIQQEQARQNKGLQKATGAAEATAKGEGSQLATTSGPMEAPWRNILSTRAVWAFILCKISVRWCSDVISSLLPTYLANVLHLSIKVNGLFNSIVSALFMISSFATGWLVSGIFAADDHKHTKGSGVGLVDEHCERTSDTTNHDMENQRASNEYKYKTRVRKIFQSVASFGSAICLVLMTHYDCDIALSLAMLFLLSCCLVVGTGGELQIPYDMSSRYPGTLHGMACTLSVSGWLAPPLIGLILGDQPSSRQRWSIVWHMTAAITLIGGLAFVLFADSRPRDFKDSGRRKRRRRTPPQEPEAKHSMASQLVEAHNLGYVNSGASSSSSSCESSPKLSHEHHLQSAITEFQQVDLETGRSHQHQQHDRTLADIGSRQLVTGSGKPDSCVAAHRSNTVSMAPADIMARLPNGQEPPEEAVVGQPNCWRQSIAFEDLKLKETCVAQAGELQVAAGGCHGANSQDQAEASATPTTSSPVCDHRYHQEPQTITHL